jgi:hypothetical protein
VVGLTTGLVSVCLPGESALVSDPIESRSTARG